MRSSRVDRRGRSRGIGIDRLTWLGLSGYCAWLARLGRFLFGGSFGFDDFEVSGPGALL